MTARSGTLEQNLPHALQVGNAGSGVPQFFLALHSFLARMRRIPTVCPGSSLPVGSTPLAQGPPLRVGRRLLGSTPVFCPHAGGSLPSWRARLPKCCTPSVSGLALKQRTRRPRMRGDAPLLPSCSWPLTESRESPD